MQNSMNKSRMQRQSLQCSKPKPPLPACNLPKWLFASKIFTLFHTGVIEISWQISWKLAFWNSKRFMSSLMYRLYRFIGISIKRERFTFTSLGRFSNLFRREGRFSPKRTDTAVLFLSFGGERVVSRVVSWGVFLKLDTLWVHPMSGARFCRVDSRILRNLSSISSMVHSLSMPIKFQVIGEIAGLQSESSSGCSLTAEFLADVLTFPLRHE